MESLGISSSINTATLAAIEAPKPEVAKQDIKLQQVTPAKESSEPLLQHKDQEQGRFEAVKRASEVIAMNPFPVSDVRFTIYKSAAANGDFIYYTRFTSLRDGKVTVVPEQQLFVGVQKDAGTILDGIV